MRVASLGSWRRGLTWGVLAVSVLLLGGFAGSATAQSSCFNGGRGESYFYDPCGTSGLPDPYEFSQAFSSSFLSIGSNKWLALALNSDVLIYNAANAPTLSSAGRDHMPWDWTSDISGATGHDAYKPLIQLEPLSGFPYAIAMLNIYGWDFFRLQQDTFGPVGFLGHGYQPGAIMSGYAYNSAALFSIGSNVYVAAQALDTTSIGRLAGKVADSSIRIYKIDGGAVSVVTLTPSTIGPGAVVPAGHSGDPAAWNNSAFPLSMNMRIAFMHDVHGSPVIVARRWGNAPVIVVDVSNPLLPTVLSLDNIAESNWAVDDDHHILWVGASGQTYVKGYQLDLSRMPAASPWKALGAVNYDPSGSPSTANVAYPSYAAGGGLLAVSNSQVTGFFSVADTGALTPVTSTDVPGFTSLPGRVCQNPGFAESIADVNAFAVGSNVFVARSNLVDADIVAISSSCMSSTPSPAFMVAATTAGAATAASCAASPTHALAAKGFPGDLFTITDSSTGAIASGTLAISGPSASGNQSWTKSGSNPWQPQPLAWQSSPSDTPGEYEVTMDLFDSGDTLYQLNKSIVVCSNPKAKITMIKVNGTPCSGSGCTYLANDIVTFSAAPGVSEGTPTLWAWYEDAVLKIGTSGTFDWQVPASGGPYTVSAAAIYGFSGGIDASCSGLTVVNGGNWASCAAYAPITPQQFTVGSVTATQTGSTFPNFNTTNPINLSAPFKLASGYNATFVWNGSVSTVGTASPATVTDSGSSQSGTVTGTIASPTIGAGQTVTLAAQATPTGGGNPIIPTVPPTTFTVTSCVTPSAATSPSPANGATGVSSSSVVLSWNASSGTTPITYNVNVNGLVPNSCKNLSATQCTLATIGGSTYTWYVTAKNSCSSSGTDSATWTFTTSGSVPTPTPTPSPTQPPGGSLSITPSPNPATPGQYVTFTFSPALSSGSDSLTFNFGVGEGTGTVDYVTCQAIPSSCNKIAHQYNPTSTTVYSVSGSGTAGGRSVSGSTSVTVQVPCLATAKPIAGFGISGVLQPFQVRVGQAVQFLDTSANSPTSWTWDFGDGIPPAIPDGKSTLQNPVYTFRAAGTYSVQLTATNCLGNSVTTATVQVLAACSQTDVPVSSFTWGPTGALSGFPEQQQPYAGQAVTFTDTSTNQPDQWQWCDFGELGPACSGTPLATKNVTVTFATAGARNVRLLAHNCVGWSTQQAINSVTIYQDVRHVVADFGWSPDPPAVDETIAFTAAQGAANGSPDTFVWTFDDTKGTQGGFQASQVTHTFTCGGTHRVTLVASRSNYPSGAQTVTKSISVDGTPCGPSSVMTVDNAKVNGLNGTQWRTDVRIFNPATTTSNVTLWFLPINANNTNPFSAGPYPIPSKGALVRDDVLGWVASTLGMAFSKTALRVTFANDQNIAPMIVSKTYTPSPGGGTYGQYAPGIGVIPGSPPASPVWITGLHNNGTQTGYRTNYSLLNLQGDSGVDPITITLYDMTGTPLKTVTQGLLPFGYVQDSIKNLFGASFDSVGTFSLKIEVPAGASVQAYGSVVDNLTGAPVLIPAGQPSPSMVYLPAVAHLNGKNGTVWRSDMQLTNTDSVAHTWAVGYVPKGSDTLLPTIVQVTVSPHQSVYMADALNWVYSNLLTDASQTSGVIKIAPSDGSSVLPAVQARSFNQTPNGTFGQNIIPLSADLGASEGGQYTRLLLTGMASADIQRTSLGFVNLSETSSVIYQAYFYDQNGNLLNPLDGTNTPIPYNFSLPPGGWDQDQLENRFMNAFSVALPGNLEAISAEIFVTGGGPGTAYATVTDNVTGDPTFIPAQAAP